jgi:large subunit ribosomal protein L30
MVNPVLFETMAKIKIQQTTSKIHTTERQKRTLAALGLKRMNATVIVEATPQILGMVEKVKHLVSTETTK